MWKTMCNKLNTKLNNIENNIPDVISLFPKINQYNREADIGLPNSANRLYKKILLNTINSQNKNRNIKIVHCQIFN